MTSNQKTTVNVVFGAMVSEIIAIDSLREGKGINTIITNHLSPKKLQTFGKPGAEQSRVHDLSTAKAILDIFQSHGHNEVDTARAYGEGTSEEMLGELDYQKRKIVLDTKYYPTANFAGPNAVPGWSTDGHLDEKGLRENLEKSLKALRTEQVDLWYLHGPDRTVPFETTLKVVNDLYQEGKFKRLGVSNYMAWEVAQMSEMCKQHGWKQIDVYQGVYNALHRSVELELLSCLRKYSEYLLVPLLDTKHKRKKKILLTPLPPPFPPPPRNILLQLQPPSRRLPHLALPPQRQQRRSGLSLRQQQMARKNVPRPLLEHTIL